MYIARRSLTWLRKIHRSESATSYSTTLIYILFYIISLGKIVGTLLTSTLFSDLFANNNRYVRKTLLSLYLPFHKLMAVIRSQAATYSAGAVTILSHTYAPINNYTYTFIHAYTVTVFFLSSLPTSNLRERKRLLSLTSLSLPAQHFST